MTSSIPSSPEGSGPLILKTDSRGRVRMPAAKREALLEEFDKSGLSGAKFAALSGVKYQTFANWVQQRRRKGQKQAAPAKREQATDPVSWLEAVVEEHRGPRGPKCGSLVLHSTNSFPAAGRAVDHLNSEYFQTRASPRGGSFKIFARSQYYLEHLMLLTPA